MSRPAKAWAVLLFVLWSATSHAVEPGADWYTIETPNFRVYFHEGEHMYALAQRVARMCEAAHERLAPKLNWAPDQKTAVIITDDVDSANGSAFTLYRPWMRLYAEVPEEQSVLNDFDDHVWILVVHEYTHVLHLDTVSSLPEAINTVFGKLLLPNAYVPRWLTEGLATYEESNLSNAGRLRSSLFDMWLRTSVLERPFDIDDVTHSPQAWPRGNLAYLYGGHFMSYVAEKVGEDALPKYFDLYGARLIPWTLNDAADQVWDRNFVELYEEWLASTQDRFRAQLEPVLAAGVTPVQVLTRAGYGTDQPHFTPDGQRIIYVESGPDRRPQVRSMKADGSDDRLIRELWTSGALDLGPDGERAVLALSDVHEEYYVYDDLYELDLRSGELKRLSWGLRATDPSYSPDGRAVAFVGRSGAGHTYLGVMDLARAEVTRIFESTPQERIYSPVFAPDGKSVLYSQQAGTTRRLASVNLESGERTTWIEGEGLHLQPEFTDDGTLLFASDRTGIYNLYAFDPRMGTVRQVTNVTTGAFHPTSSPDGSRIAFTYYTVDGYDIAVMETKDAFGQFAPARPQRPAASYVDDPRQVAPVQPYDPLPTLAPLYWLPIVSQDPRGLLLGVVTGGGDILDRHLYSLELNYGLQSGEPGVYAAYSNRTFHPGVDTYVTTGIAQAAGFRAGLYDRQWAAGAQMTFPNSSLDSYAALNVGYELRYFDPQFDVTYQPDSPRPTLPRRGTTGVLSLGFYYSNARGFADSISAEEGHTLSATLRHSSPFTLGTFTFSSAEARYQTYLRMPWLEHHALALQLSTGVAFGDVGNRPVFALGGVGLADPIIQLIRGGRVGSGVLRGYPSRAISGNTFGLGTLEYRFPIAVVDFGVGTLPLYIRRVHGAVFTDVGVTGRRAFEIGDPRGALGAEARADLVLGYALGAMLRLGAAQGLTEDGITSVYLTLGSTF